MKVADRPAWLRRDMITDSQRRSSALVEHLERLVTNGGETTHGAGGDSMPFFLAELEARKVPYQIVARPGSGYKIVVAAPGDR